MFARHGIITLGFLVFFQLFIKLQAQVQCKFEHYSTQDGLSHNGILSMLKDRDGFMWFATWDGINRFDGKNFIIYTSRPGDSSKLKHTRIDYIVEDKSGYLWLKTYDQQVYRFDKRTGKFFAIADIPGQGDLNNILFDRIFTTENGQVWLSTTTHELYGINNTGAAIPSISRYARGLNNGFHLPGGAIHFFYEDRQHNIWVATNAGLCCLSLDKGGVFKNHNINNKLISNLVFTSIAEENDRIWLTAKSGELVSYGKSSKQFSIKKLAEYALNSICISRDQKDIYISTAKSEILTLHISTFEISKAFMPGADPFFSIFEDKSGLLWIEPENHGVVKFNPSTGSFKTFVQKNDATLNNPTKYYNVFEDIEQRVWVSMKGGGFGYYNPVSDKVEYFHNEPGSPDHWFSNIISCKYLDPEGVLWQCTSDRGIDKIIFQRNDFNYKPLVVNTLNKSDNEVRAIFNDDSNRLWLASKSGKVYLEQNGEKRTNLFINEPQGGIGLIYTILQDRNGIMWFGTKGNGLFRAEPVNQFPVKYKLTHFLADKKDPYSLSSNLIYNLFEDKEGRIWVGTYENGLNLIRFKSNKIEFIHPHNEFVHYPKENAGKIRHIQQDASGNLWIGTTNGLLVSETGKKQFRDYRFIAYRKNPEDKTTIGNNDVQYILRDAKSRMWVATSGGGLNLVEGADINHLRFKIYTREDGLPTDYLLSIAEDKQGNLWIATENVLSKFNPEKQLFRNHDAYDGLPNKGFSEASALRMKDGKLVFGCVNGYLVFDPAAILTRKIKAGMAFTNFQVNNREVVPGAENSPLAVDINSTNEVNLTYHQNTISIDFAVLDYRSNNKQGFAYRLNGFDKEWHQVVNQHKATYTNLSPGKYLFEVKSLAVDLYENTPVKTLQLTILPPWWRTTWAYLLYFGLLVILFETARRIALTMIRLRNKIAVERRLTDLKLSFFTNISHELRTPLTLISNPIEEVLRQEKLSERGYAYINVARRNTNRMIRFINQLLDFRKLQSGKMALKIAHIEIVSFVKEISGYFSEAAIEKKIELIISSNVNELPAWVDGEKIDIVIYNLLSNAFKFSPGETVIQVKITAHTGGDYFTISVTDQGPGVPPSKLNDIFELYYEVDKAEQHHQKGTGIGLALSKEIIQLHHGTISAKNNYDKGLTITVTLKTGKEHFKKEEISLIPGPSKTTTGIAPFPGFQKKNPPLLTEEAALPQVLIVEDNRELREFLCDQLHPYYTVITAEDGKEGYEKACQFLPDLVLSDVMMPNVNGIQLLDQLKTNVITSHIPVILLTAKSSVESQVEGLNYGADYYITKPFQTNLLLAAIDNIINQRKRIFETLLGDKPAIKLSPGEISITSKDETFLKEVISIVESGMEDPQFNIDTVATSLRMGRTTFYKKFKSLTNMAPVEFIRDMRLKRSKQLMDGGENNISEIAYLVGFSNAKYFSTCFKDHYQMTPSEYLKATKPLSGKEPV